MAHLVLQNARISGFSVVTGEHEHAIDDTPEYYNNDPALLDRLKNIIGFDKRFTAAPTTTTSDMCLQAATSLLDALSLTPEAIDSIISVTQTPDYSMPGNAHVLHHKLGLSKQCPALDVELGCSGFIYGLWLAAMMVGTGMRRVLLVAGDTLSKAANVHDRSLAPLFGDAGSATLIEFSPTAQDMHFILRADGAGLEKMYIPAGAYRTPSTEHTRQEVLCEEGGTRSLQDLYMNGFGIFEFTMAEQPGLLRDILEFSQKTIADVDYFILHQANRYIVDTITKKAKIPPEKAPSCTFSQFGNQNSASIPGVLCGTLHEQLAGKSAQVVLQGYGIGLSWGACQTRLDNLLCLPPVRHSLS